MSSQFIASKKPEFDKAFEHLRQELSSIRTGRANAAILDTIQVEAYGSMMEIKSLASVGVPDARTITIEPWDKSVLHALETAIQKSDLGINPVNDGKLIRLSMPQMTEESRTRLTKVMKEKLEEGRVAVRQVREKVREEVLAKEKAKEIPEDERFKLLEELDKLVKEIGAEIDQMGKKKEEEIMTV